MENQFAAVIGPERAAKPLTLGIVLHPFVTALDFVGPLTALNLGVSASTLRGGSKIAVLVMMCSVIMHS